MNMKEKCTHTHLTRRGESNALEEWRNSSLVKKIPKLTGEEFTNEDWLHCLYRRRFKTRYEICKDEDGKISDIRAIRRHSSEIITPSRLNYIMFHYKESDTHTEEGITQRNGDTQRKWHTVYCEDQARDQHYVAKAGLVTEEKERKEENQPIFFANRNTDEVEATTDVKKPRKVNYQIYWRSEQNAEYWILSSAMRTPTFCAILVKPRSNLQMWDFDPIPSESRNWSNEALQGRAVHTKDSQKDNSLSEKAAKKIHEAGDCELHKANSSNSLQTPTWYSKKWKRRGVQGVHALTQLGMILRDEPRLRFKIPHKGNIENQKKSMPRETEKH